MAKKSTEVAVPKPALGKRIKANWQLYLLLLIPFVLTFIYKYIPMYGIQIAFRDYKASRGMFGSEWVGLKWFERFFTAPTAGRMIRNTFLLALYSLLWSFPIPIILSLCINQLRFASIIVAAAPMLIVYPFVQKYFEKGMMAGAVKG